MFVILLKVASSLCGLFFYFCACEADLGPNTLKSIQIHYNYFDLSMITITLQLQDL